MIFKKEKTEKGKTDCCFRLSQTQVTYSCVSSSGLDGRLVQVCEGGSLSIHCQSNKKINILTANYGRLTGAHICGGPIRTTNCGAAGALGKVRDDCQGRSGCTLIANNGKFGDPCFGTSKYLEVRSFQ